MARPVVWDDDEAEDFLRDLIAPPTTTTTPTEAEDFLRDLIAPPTTTTPTTTTPPPLCPATITTTTTPRPATTTTTTIENYGDYGDPRVQSRLRRGGQSAGIVLEHCRDIVALLISKEPTAFKIGLTVCPYSRFYQPRYGYSGFFDKMVVLFVSDHGSTAAMVEAHLIHVFKATIGCHNEAPGGEGLAPSGPFFVYVVLKNASVAVRGTFGSGT
jgi:hypothetical protein